MVFWWNFFRVNQWSKNFLIMVPAFFAGINFTTIWENSLISFFGFSLICSGIYILNDFKDKDSDIYHPRKKGRSEKFATFSIKKVFLFSCSFFLIGLILLSIVQFNILNLGIIYLLNGLGYNYFFKRYAFLDIAVLIIGYIIRLLIGAYIANVPISLWLFGMIISLTSIFILMKRWSDVIVFNETGIVLRNTVLIYKKWNIYLMIKLILVGTFVFYCSYLGYVYSLFRGENLSLYFTLINYLIFSSLLLKTIQKTPHHDPLKMIFSQPLNILGMLVSASIFYYVIHFK